MVARLPARALLPVALALAGLATAVLPEAAGSASVSATANLTWSPSAVTINQGDSVTWSNSTGVCHNIVIEDSNGNVVGNGPPTQASGCVYSSHPVSYSFTTYTQTFNTPGIYPFYCEVHRASGMTGTLTVNPASTSPGSTPPPGISPPSATTPTSGYPAFRRLVVAAVQRGTLVRGRVTIGQPGSRFEADLFASPAQIRATRLHRIGRTVMRAARAGRLRFKVALNGRAKRALKRRRKLVVTLRIAVKPPSGKTSTAKRKITLRR